MLLNASPFDIIYRMTLHSKKWFTYNYIMTINQASREELLRNAICCVCSNVKWIWISHHKIKINNSVQHKYIFFIYEHQPCFLIQQCRFYQEKQNMKFILPCTICLAVFIQQKLKTKLFHFWWPRKKSVFWVLLELIFKCISLRHCFSFWYD